MHRPIVQSETLKTHETVNIREKLPFSPVLIDVKENDKFKMAAAKPEVLLSFYTR